MSEVYYPGWCAKVNGRPARILPANFAFRAVYLEPGAHRVRMIFLPLSWFVGLGISVLTWCALFIVVVARWHAVRKHIDR